MKIVVINGQSHKGSTWNIGNMLLESLDGEKEVREYFLPRDLDHFCNGCFACLEDRARCPYWKEKEPILRDMLEAELLVLFFTNWLTHRPPREMFSKKAVVISTAAGAGAKKAAKLIAGNLINWGIPEVHTYAAVVNAMRWDMIPPKSGNRKGHKKAGA